jgi:hypothetical protein
MQSEEWIAKTQDKKQKTNNSKITRKTMQGKKQVTTMQGEEEATMKARWRTNARPNNKKQNTMQKKIIN